MTEDWTKQWERRIVNGVYPLRRFLGRSNHSVVFLTEFKAQNLAEAAIKILPAHRSLTEAQLGHWRTAATLSHPHLIRLHDADRCQLGGHNFLYVVTDLAEQNLAQILPGRPLTPDEVRELLPATLDALSYLHSKNLVHGGLKPPNFLVVDDRLRLACDTIRPAGQPTASTAKPSVYDPPEAKHGRISTAGDIWALGITLVEALTQTPPVWSRDSADSVALPATLAPEFLDTLQRCLSRDPGQRPTIAQLVAQFKTSLPATSPSTSPPVMHEPVARSLDTQISPKTRRLATAIGVGLIALWGVWTALHLFRNHTNPTQTSATTLPLPPAVPPPIASPRNDSPPNDSPAAAVQTPKGGAPAALPWVMHQEMPNISRHARESIRGVIQIAVRTSVDRSGKVISAALDGRASSPYFARAATDAAKLWKFSPAADSTPRVWLLHFDLSRSGTIARADTPRP